MAAVTYDLLVRQLRERKQRLESALERGSGAQDLGRLLDEVDSALARVADGTYGLCEVCHETVEADRLLADPLLRFCLDHLTESEQRDLERDLQTAARVQRGLLPSPELAGSGWEAHFHWEPAGLVSGDWYDLIRKDGGELFFMFGDVSGKGVAAALLMSHLHATFRALVAAESTVAQLVERANRVFRESTLSPYFATLVCGRAGRDGAVEICNAGHCPPLVVGAGGITAVDPTGLPVGTFYSTAYASRTLTLGPGDSLVLYTDGLTEARNRADAEYGVQRLTRTLARTHGLAPRDLVVTCLEDLAAHMDGAPRRDDLTVMALRRTA
ncbi:MAG TPA: SpoIIE family protein phosphatase [Thermoanaerobaculaceae bacterium]|nr:SpoIIE family protein phosphatase [Thermoanaerobaculaceae bacterium]